MKKLYFLSCKSTVFVLLLVVLLPFSGYSQGQPTQKTRAGFQQFIGIQFNPHFSQSFFSGNIRQYPFALRYGWIAPSGISFGPEFSGFFGHSNSAKWHVLNFGLFIRYTFLRQKSVSPFIEASGFYQTGELEITDDRYGEEVGDTHTNSGFSYYVTPGISINLYKKRLLLDFMVQLSTNRFLNGEYYMPSIRLVYRF